MYVCVCVRVYVCACVWVDSQTAERKRQDVNSVLSDSGNDHFTWSAAR